MIERPWEELACDKCIHCFDDDFCSAYRLGMSYAFCPHVRNCEKFVEGRAERQSGKWKEYTANGIWYYDCPFCDDGYASNERQEHPENYCSNCGAKMDGKEKVE